MTIEILLWNYNRIEKKQGIVVAKKKKKVKKIQMTKTSPFVSKAWAAERPEVKQEYKELANKVELLLKQVREEHFVIVPAEIPRRRGSAQPTISSSPSSLSLEEIFDFPGYFSQ